MMEVLKSRVEHLHCMEEAVSGLRENQELMLRDLLSTSG
jgi:hypothetical protein